MIVKCQRSIASNCGPLLLFYNRARGWYLQCELTKDWNERFGKTLSPEDNRFFAEVTWQDRGRPPIFKHTAPEQGW
jgi:hypothetical protein